LELENGALLVGSLVMVVMEVAVKIFPAQAKNSEAQCR